MLDNITEIWKDIQGYEGYYQVSNMGRVKSVARIVKTKDCKIKSINEKILKPVLSTDYPTVGLYKHKKGKNYPIHYLVLISFVEPRPEGQQCRHLDGNPSNNLVSNLCWGTAKENSEDRIRHGTTRKGIPHNNRGERQGRARLTDQKVAKILELWNTGKYRKICLAEMFDASRGSITQIIDGTLWKHVPRCDPHDRVL